MIHYDLKCTHGHVFQAWFRDSATFERQAAQGEIACALCGDTGITRAPMAPNVVSSRKRDIVRAQEAAEASPAEVPATVPAPAPVIDPAMLEARAKAMAVLKEMRTKVEENCDYVGDRFAEEARKIHYGETKARGIYGQADAAEAASLREEGIEFARIPWLPLDN